MGYFIATLIGATLAFNAGDVLASEQNQRKGLWIEYENSERSVDDRHCSLNFLMHNYTETSFRNIEIRDYIELLDSNKLTLDFGTPIYDKDNEKFKKNYFTGLIWHPFLNTQQEFIGIGNSSDLAIFAKDVKCHTIKYISFKISSKHSYITRTLIPNSQFSIKDAKEKIRNLSGDKKTLNLLKLTVKFEEDHLADLRRKKVGITCHEYKGGEIDCYEDVAVNFGKVWKNVIKE